MTDTTEQPAATEPVQPNFVIQRIYLKDSSFEAPNTPQIFLDEWKPQVEIEIQNRSHQISDDTHEVILRVTVTAKIEQKVAFLVDVQQAGIFSIHNASAEQISPIVGSYCPSILFPYARQTIASLSMQGGFPPINLAPVNFDAAYQQHMQQQQATAEIQDTQH